MNRIYEEINERYAQVYKLMELCEERGFNRQANRYMLKLDELDWVLRLFERRKTNHQINMD